MALDSARAGRGGGRFRHESGRQQARSGALFRHALFRQRQADVAVDHGRFLVYRRVAAAGPRGAEDGRLDSGDRCGRWRALLALFCYGLDIGHPSSGNVVLGGPGRLRARPEQGCKPGQVSRFLSRDSMREHVRRRGVLRAALRSGLARSGYPPSRRDRAAIARGRLTQVCCLPRFMPPRRPSYSSASVNEQFLGGLQKIELATVRH